MRCMQQNRIGGEDIMPREKELYRENLDRLDKAFPNKEVLSQIDVAIYTGKSLPTINRRKWYDPKIGGISKTKLASLLS